MIKANNNVRNHATPILLSLFSAGLAGCSTVDTATTGVALKGLLDNAEVFIDVDGDGVWTAGVDSDKVRTEADGSFSIDTELTGDIVVQTDETTIDASSGAVLAGIKMSAMAGSSVVTLATTIANELVDSSKGTLSQADAEAQVKTILGLDASTEVSSYNAYAAENAGTAESVAFEKAAQQVMTVINTLAEAEATSSLGSAISKSAALNNAVAAFVDVIEAKIAAAAEPDAAPLVAIDFKSDTIVNDVVSAAKLNDTDGVSVFNNGAFDNSLSAIKTAITSVNKAIDDVTSLDAGSKQIFSVAQSSLIDMTQTVASTNDASKGSITDATNFSTLVVVKGITAGIVTEDDATVTDKESGNLVFTGTALVADPNTADNVTYSFDSTVAPARSDSLSGDPLGILTITAEGVWRYTLNNDHAEVQALGVNDALIDVFQIKTIATDATNPDSPTTADSSAKYVSVRVVGSNDTPTVSAEIVDQTIAEDSVLSFTIPAATFADVDTSDTSTVTATLESGAELPSWLTFTASTGVLSGTPTNDQVGSINITVTSTDASNASVSDTFTIEVTNTNDAPTVSSAIVDQTIAEDSTLSFTIPSATFADVDTGDTSTLTATLTGGGELPSWLTFTAATGVLSGTPTNDEVGSIDITVTSTDTIGTSASDSFLLTTTNTNDAPTVTSAQAALETSENVDFSYTVPNATFDDIDVGDILTYSATLTSGGALPAWLSFDADTKTFTGTPASSDIAELSIKVTASDGTATASDTLALTVTDNAMPSITTEQTDQNATQGSAFTYTVPANTFADLEDADSSLTITATDLPDGLTFASGTISGTPTNAAVGVNTVSITATDSGDASVTDQITITVANVNDAPTVANPQTNQTTTEDSAFTYTVPTDTFADVDTNDTSLTITQTGLPDGLTLTNGIISGTPTNADVGTHTVSITASDSADVSVTDQITITVANVNDAPTVANQQTNQTATEDSAFTYTVPTDTFADVDTNDSSLTITATGLPDGLILSDGIISGTPNNAAVGVSTVSITATDGADASVTDQITITVANVNDAPTVANELIDQTIITGRESTYIIPADTFNDIDTGDTATLTYTVTPIPSWGGFDEDTLTITGTPPDIDVEWSDVEVVVTATDTTGAHVSSTFIFSVTANQAPVVAILGNQTATEDTAVSFSLADDKFTDGNGDAMTVTVSGNPSWLAFDASTKTFSGTPISDSDAGTSTIIVSATDASNATGTATFNLVTTAVNDAHVFTSTSSVNVTENSFTAATVVVSDEESDTMTYTLAGTDASSFSIDSNTGTLSFIGGSRTDMNFLLDSSGAQGGLMVDNLTTTDGGATLKMDLFVLPKVVDIEALKGIQFTPTSTGTAADFDFYFSSSTLPKKHDQSVDEEGDDLFDNDGNAVYDTVTGSGGKNGTAAIWYSDSAYSRNDMAAIKIGILKISNYDADNIYSIDTLLMGGGDAGVSASANYTLSNLILSPVVDLPDFGDNASVAGSDSYSVEITATDTADNATVQSLTVTLDDTATNVNSSTSTATWTGTTAADTYTIDSLTASADGDNGDNDVAKISIENHTTWDTTGGTSDLAATLVDMEIIDIGNVISSNDSSPVVIGDFSTNMTIDATSAASMIVDIDSQVSIMGTTNDIVTLSGTDWVKSTSSSLLSGDYSSQVLDAWSDGTSTLHIDHEINIVTPDIA